MGEGEGGREGGLGGRERGVVSFEVLDEREVALLHGRALVPVVLVPQVALRLRVVRQVEQRAPARGASGSSGHAERAETAAARAPVGCEIGARAVRDLGGEDGDVARLHLARRPVEGRLRLGRHDPLGRDAKHAALVLPGRELEATVLGGRLKERSSRRFRAQTTQKSAVLSVVAGSIATRTVAWWSTCLYAGASWCAA